MPGLPYPAFRRVNAEAGGSPWVDGSPSAEGLADKCTRPPWIGWEKGELLVGNQENYQKVLSMTRFGGASNLANEPIRLIPLSDVKGLPAETPFRTTTLHFVTVHPGEARVAVCFPRAVPPSVWRTRGTTYS